MGLSLATQIALAIAGAALASVGILAVIAPDAYGPISRRTSRRVAAAISPRSSLPSLPAAARSSR